MNLLRLLLLVALLALTAGCSGEAGGAPHFDGDELVSAGGLLHGSVRSRPAPPPINEMHSWTLHLEDEAGNPVEDAEISVDGDMPAHGHGLPTQPRVTEYLGNGDYLIEGMQFQMGGDWYVEFTITAAGTSDTLRFDFRL